MCARGGGARLTCLAALTACLAAAGCAPLEPGADGARDELNRKRGLTGFAVIEDAPRRTVIAAKGRDVVVAPDGGLCVATDSLDVSGSAAFALLADCGDGADGALPSIVTVSISGASMVDPGVSTEQALAGLRAFLETEEGLGLLGRSGGTVRVEAVRDVGTGVYVLVEDAGGRPLPVLSPRFWRAFVELNGRMVMVTVSSFRERPLDDETMLAALARQVVALRRANRSPASRDELALAATAPAASGRYRTARVEPEGSGDAIDEPEPAEAGQAVAVLPPASVSGATYGGFGAPPAAPAPGAAVPPYPGPAATPLPAPATATAAAPSYPGPRAAAPAPAGASNSGGPIRG